MGKLAKITSVTAAAEEIIPRYLDDEPAVALFVAASFLDVRLETVVRIFFESKGKNVKALYSDMKLKPMIRLAYAFDILDKSEHDEFLALADKRNNLGHETEMWRKRNDEDDRIYRRLTNRALDFITANGSKEKILARLSATSGGEPPRRRRPK